MLLLLYCVFIVRFIHGAKILNCSKSETYFVKIFGTKTSNLDNPMLLYEGEPLSPITEECLAKCLDNDQCLDFVLYYNASICYWYKNSRKPVDDFKDIADPNAVWFSKTCLRVNGCQKSWIFERITGATLIGNDEKTLPDKLTRIQCQQHCLEEPSFTCRSAKYRISKSNRNLGTCTLSDSDRHFLPNSYRASNFYDEYLENQCVDVHESEFCSYEEYENATFTHVDQFFNDVSKEECQRRCETTQNYNCRGYSIVPLRNQRGIYSCYLHSEDTKVNGPKVLEATNLGKYYEKARCLNVSVSCTESYLTVKYVPEINFSGRVYMQGYSDKVECYVKGQGLKPLILRIPLSQNFCGITKARANPSNQTLLSVVMVIQYNQFIQTQGDRLIRVGCIFNNETKVLLGTGVNVTGTEPKHSTTVVNSSASAPTVEMRVVDALTQLEAVDTQIGQELQMIIEVKPADGPYDIWAGHLVAMTQNSDESIFLLDDRGCPTNLNIFPAFSKIKTNETNQLVATFQAFKFASSPVIRFSVIVQFCPSTCPEVTCGKTTPNRQKRQVKLRLIDPVESTKVIKINRTEFGQASKTEELPLEFIMVVRDPKISSDRYVVGERNKILVAGFDPVANQVCLDYSLMIGIVITWVLVQIIFFICCTMLIRRYKKYYEDELMHQSLETLHRNFGLGFSNLDNRRVHWADDTELT